MAHKHYMALALAQARMAAAVDEVPIGAVLVNSGQVVASAHNATISQCDPTAHAECEVIRNAARVLGNHRLVGSTLYVTLEPCMMCVGAMIQARIASLHYAADDRRVGVISTGWLKQVAGLNHQMEVHGGLMAQESAAILEQFFHRKRGNQS